MLSRQGVVCSLIHFESKAQSDYEKLLAHHNSVQHSTIRQSYCSFTVTNARKGRESSNVSSALCDTHARWGILNNRLYIPYLRQTSETTQGTELTCITLSIRQCRTDEKVTEDVQYPWYCRVLASQLRRTAVNIQSMRQVILPRANKLPLYRGLTF